MTIASAGEAILVLLLGATVVFLMVRVAARAYRDKPEVWRGQAFLSGRSRSSVVDDRWRQKGHGAVHPSFARRAESEDLCEVGADEYAEDRVGIGRRLQEPGLDVDVHQVGERAQSAGQS